MNLPIAPPQYDPKDQAQLRGTVEREDKRNLKAGTVFDAILMRDTVTGVIKTVTVASGALVVT
jgi:hypothetical protein